MDDLNQDKLAGGRVDFLGLLEEVSNCLNYIMTFWEFGCMSASNSRINFYNYIQKSTKDVKKCVVTVATHLLMYTIIYYYGISTCLLLLQLTFKNLFQILKRSTISCLNKKLSC